MKPSDTSLEVQNKYDELWRALSLEERFLKGFELISLCRELTFAGYKMRYPNLSTEELRLKMMKEIYEDSYQEGKGKFIP